jgi:hypothetical protein
MKQIGFRNQLGFKRQLMSLTRDEKEFQLIGAQGCYTEGGRANPDNPCSDIQLPCYRKTQF